MELIFETIHDALNMLIPDAQIEHFGDMNKVIAYLITLGIVWLFVARPIIKVFFKR